MDFIIVNGTLERYTGTDSEVIIPSNVTEIGWGAFYKCLTLNKVTISDSVTNIIEAAFQGCSELLSVYIPNSVKCIGDKAFEDCTNLNNIVLPESVESIGKRAFKNCKSIVSISIPESVTSIGSSAFAGCDNLKTITLPDTVSQMGSNVFPDGVSLYLTKYIDGIEKEADFKSLVIRETPVQSIKIKKIKQLAVKGFLSEADNTYYDDKIVESYKKYLKGRVNDYVDFILNNDTEHIITKLAAMDLLDKDATDTILKHELQPDIRSFLMQCKNNGEADDSIDDLFSLDKPYDPFSEEEMRKNWSFKKSSKGITIDSYLGFEKDVTVPEMIGGKSVVSIGKEAFSPSRKGLDKERELTLKEIESITLPASIQTIGEGAFKNCRGLKKINIPKKVTKIGRNAFDGCGGLTEITIPDGITTIEKNTFLGCYSIKHLVIPDTVKSIESDAFGYCRSLESIILPKGLTKIEDGTFVKCENLTDINIPHNVTEIGRMAFNECNGLKRVDLPDTVERISERAFFYCENLEGIDLGKSLCNIGEGVFWGCSKLKEIILPKKLGYVTKELFKECTSLERIVIERDEYFHYGGERTFMNAVPTSFFSGAPLAKVYVHRGIEEVFSTVKKRVVIIEDMKN